MSGSEKAVSARLIARVRPHHKISGMTQVRDANDQPSRFVVGIDLGTTNSSAAFVDTADRAWKVRDFRVAQLVAAGTVEGRETLPSFHYQPAEGEFAPGSLHLPWLDEDQKQLVGHLAHEQGTVVPGRLVSSAKSWLSHPGVDRTVPLLPWHGAADVERLSPVDASARYLEHIRRAWDFEHPEHPLAQQDVVLTVPASFDEVARELTVEAAKRAGLVKLTLVEEPQAAFYAWINAHARIWQGEVKAGQKILVIDIGGGTTDFTLIRVRPAGEGKVLFHRVAVGQHLILGGDNLDLALAHHIETKAAGGGKLPASQWGPLVRSARVLKEQFMGAKSPEKLTVNLAAGGSKLIGGGKQVEVSAKEVRQLIVEGFLPHVGLEEKPAARRSGFQEFNLPYAPDPAITRYLAAFLTAHRDAGMDEDGVIKIGGHDLARPDVVLFNGGFFESPALRERLLEALGAWFTSPDAAEPWRPKVLDNERLDLAVSRGAAYYGMVRRGVGVRITGGLAHSYYIGVDVKEDGAAQSRAVCLLPAGVEEGQDVPMGRTFNLLIRQPVEFPLYYSATRTTDDPGALVELDPEQLTTLPPIRTVLQSGRKSAADTVAVNLHAKLTEIGTLQLWAQEAKGDRQWRLEFDVRSANRAEVERHTGEAEVEGFVDAGLLPPSRALVQSAFTTAKPQLAQLPAPATPASLVKRLELVAGMSRLEWPTSLLRSFWEMMIEVAEGRRLSVDHEARWLSFTGFCLRPGYGLAVDDWRVAQVWRLNSQKVLHPKNELCRAEWWILWRRVAGGLTAGQQLTLAEPLIAAMKSRLRAAGPINQPKTSPFQYGPHESAEVWRLLGSLELLRMSLKEELGSAILDLLPREKASASLFALGRLGSRTPVYGPLNALVPPELAEQWVARLMAWEPKEDDQRSQHLFALVQLARRTDDRYRDLSDAMRQKVVDHLRQHAAPGRYIELVSSGGHLGEEEQKLAFGESLPRGLRID